MPHWKSIAFCAAVSYVSMFMAGCYWFSTLYLLPGRCRRF